MVYNRFVLSDDVLQALRSYKTYQQSHRVRLTGDSATALFVERSGAGRQRNEATVDQRQRAQRSSSFARLLWHAALAIDAAGQRHWFSRNQTLCNVVQEKQ